jgi:hypothetical protein
MARKGSFAAASRGQRGFAEATPRCAIDHRAKAAQNPRRQPASHAAAPARLNIALIRRSTHRRLQQAQALRLSSVVFFRRQGFARRELLRADLSKRSPTPASPTHSLQIIFYWKLPRGSAYSGPFFEQLVFAIDQGIDVVRGELKPVPVGDRIGRACLDAITAENTARIIDVVHARITFARRNAFRIRIFSGLYINAICRARRRTQEAPYALFQAAFVAVQHVNPTIARLKMHRLVRIILGDRLPKDISEGHAESLR